MQKTTRSKIQVAIRVRPLIEKELKKKEQETLMIDTNQIVAYDPIDRKYNNKKKKNDVLHRSRTQQFAFDNVFTSQPIQDIYNKTARTLIQPLLNGFNSCVFAYGATGTGKTHTMLGDKDSNTKGIIYLCLEEIFQQKQKLSKEYDISLTVSYVEIYNEYIRDLLVKDTKGKYLSLRDSASKNVKIAGAKIVKVEKTEEIMKLLYEGNERRKTESTGANKVSSRSHAIFQLYFQSVQKQANNNQKGIKKLAKLSLIDLAGSERGSKTQNKGKRMEEGANINKSLLALANCINALRDKKKGSYINYRDSKLTRLLKDSLGGKSLTVMIVTVSPASSQFEESINTLKYANRAKEIKTRAIQNQKLIEFQIKGYQDVMKEIQNETQQLAKNFLSRAKQVVKSKQKLVKKKVLSPKEEQKEMRKIKQKILDNFDQRIQIIKALIEIKAQNSINEKQINGHKTDLLTFTMKQTGQLLLEKDFDKLQFQDLPENLASKKKEIDLLVDSTQDNVEQQQKMVQELKNLHKQSEKLMQRIQDNIQIPANKEILYLIIQNKLSHMKNSELKYNLRIQQILNNQLVKKIQYMKSIGEQNGLYLEDIKAEVQQQEEEFYDDLNDSEDMEDEIIENFENESFSDKDQ